MDQQAHGPFLMGDLQTIVGRELPDTVIEAVFQDIFRVHVHEPDVAIVEADAQHTKDEHE